MKNNIPVYNAATLTGKEQIPLYNNCMSAEREKELTTAQALAAMKERFGLEPTLSNVPEYFKRLRAYLDI